VRVRHGVVHARRVARMRCARKVTAHECQMGHEQASQQCSKATEHDSKLSAVDKVREVSRPDYAPLSLLIMGAIIAVWR